MTCAACSISTEYIVYEEFDYFNFKLTKSYGQPINSWAVSALYYPAISSHHYRATFTPVSRGDLQSCIWVQGAALYRCTGVQYYMVYRAQVYTMVTIPSSCVMDCHGCSISSPQCQVKPTFVGVQLCLGRRYCLWHKYDTTTRFLNG